MNDPRLKELVREALAMGLPMPLNWDNSSEDADDSDDYEVSVQAEDDPEEKEVRNDCGSQTTEDCHGGNEATRSIEDSLSVANDGQEDRDSDQTNGGDNGEDNSGNHTRSAKVQALIDAMKKHHDDAYSEPAEWVDAQNKIYNTIVEICQLDCGRVRHHQTSWDTRAMARDVAIGRWDKVLHDKHWSYRPRNLVVFWDQSGSCDSYISAVHNALKTVAELGYRCTLFDASNGIEETESVVWTKTGPNQTTEDYYNNGPRLKKVAKNIGAKTDKNIICPSIADFIQICEKADVVIVLQDYDCVQPLFEAASKVSRRKCPYFIDLETRYTEPCEHDWNPGMYEGQEYPVPDRWHRIWSDRGTD